MILRVVQTVQHPQEQAPAVPRQTAGAPYVHYPVAHSRPQTASSLGRARVAHQEVDQEASQEEGDQQGTSVPQPQAGAWYTDHLSFMHDMHTAAAQLYDQSRIRREQQLRESRQAIAMHHQERTSRPHTASSATRVDPAQAEPAPLSARGPTCTKIPADPDTWRRWGEVALSLACA